MSMGWDTEKQLSMNQRVNKLIFVVTINRLKIQGTQNETGTVPAQHGFDQSVF